MKRLGILLGLGCAGWLALAPSSALAQATRTWVSGTGDDVNPCSRTAPCKTFAGAISKTAAGGEINCIDPAGYGGVTISKSIQIICDNTEAGVLVTGTNAFTVNAAATDKVLLSGLDIEGVNNLGTNGVHVIQVGTITVRNSSIRNFSGVGVNLVAGNTGARAIIENVKFFNNTGGGFVAQGANGVAIGAALIGNTFDLNGVAHVNVVGPASVSLTGNIMLSPGVPSVQSSNSATVISYSTNVFRGSSAGVTVTTTLQ